MSPHEDWHTAEFPEWRDGPPWVMEEMIAAEPGIAVGVAAQVDVAHAVGEAIRESASRHEPVVVTGCGTSEHAAMAVAAQLDEALRSVGLAPGAVECRQAFEASLDPRPGGVCIGVSHEAGTAATVAALRAARDAEAETVLITAAPDGPAAASAAHVVATPLRDGSWCHTVGYVSPILAGALIAGEIAGRSFDARAVERQMDGGLTLRRAAAEVAERLSGADRLVVVGSGLDRIAAREFSLKVIEGARLPAVAHDLETLLHGFLVAESLRTGFVLFLTDPANLAPRAGRAAQALEAVGALGATAAAVVSAEADAALPGELTPAGRLVVEPSSVLPPSLSAVASAAMALQEITLALVMRAGVNPDLIGRELASLREAAAAVEGELGA